MPLSLDKIKQATHEIKMDLYGDTLTLTVRAGVYTPEYLNSLGGKGAADLALDLVEKWDLLDEDGVTPYPLTRESLEKLPAAFLSPLVEALHGGMVPNPTRPARSGSFS